MRRLFFVFVFVAVHMASFDKNFPEGNVLIIPMPIFSASYKTACLARELKSHGYNVTVVLPEGLLRETITDEFDLDVIISDGMTRSLKVIDDLTNTVTQLAINGSNWVIPALPELEQVCNIVVTDKELIKILQERKFSIAIINMLFINLCGSVIPYKLSIPFIREEVMPFDMRNLINPAIFPVNVLTSTDHMTYLKRLGITLVYLFLLIRPDVFNPSDVVGKFAPEKSHITNEELQVKTELYLMDYDELIDYHLPLYPNMIPVGGLATRAPRELSGELKVFMDSAVGGAVIVSLGSVIKWIPDTIRNKILSAFQQLTDLKFVFKYGNVTSVAGNVMFLQWLPQNDVLGHPNAKLFITHCGQNAQFDALNNAVPVIGLPVFGDQPYNAMKMQDRGYGITLNILDLTSKQLIAGINTVLNTPSYKQNIAKASAIFKSRQYTPAQRAVWWIDHVIKYGGNHLRPPVSTIPYFQIPISDVIASTVTLFACFIFTCYLSFKACCLSVKCLFRVFWTAVRKQKRD